MSSRNANSLLQSVGSSKIYSIDPHTRTLSLIGGGVFALGFGLIFPAIVVKSGLQQPVPDLIGTGIVATLSIAIAIYTIWFLLRWLRETSLHFDDEGLRYHTPGLTIQTTWANVERLHVRYGKAELVLHAPAVSSIDFGTRFQQVTTSAGRNLDRRIPLSIFSVWSRQSQLYQDIIHFGPHLIQETEFIGSQKKQF